MAFWRSYPWTGSAEGSAFGPADCTGPTVEAEGSQGFTLAWVHATHGTVRVIGRLDHKRGLIGLRFTATKTLHRMQFRFQVDPSEFLSWGCRGGEDIATPHILALPIRFGDPGPVTTTETQSPTCDIGGIPLAYFWDEDPDRGLLFRMDDADGVGKFMTITGQTTSTLVEVDVFPPNRRDATHGAFSQSWELQLRPMRGHAWFASAWHGKAREVDGHIGMSRGPVDGTADFSQRARNTKLVYHGTADTASLANFQVMREDMRRLSAYFGTSDILAYCGIPNVDRYGPWPDGVTIDAQVRAELDGIVTDGSGHLSVYTFSTLASDSTAWWAANSPSAYMMKDHTGALTETDYGGNPHHYPNLGHSALRTAMWNYWKAIRGASGFAQLGSIYLDAVGGAGALDDFSTSVPAASRGAGSSFYSDGARAFYEMALAEFRDTDPDWAALAEFPSEQQIHVVDLVSQWFWEATALIRRWSPMAVWAWQNRVPGWFSFVANGINPLGVATDALAFDAAFKWARGQKFTMVHTVDRALESGYMIPEEGEPEYDSRWLPAERDYYAYLKTLYVDSWDVLQPFREGILLPPLPNSQDEDVRRNGWSNDPVIPNPSLGVHSFARYRDREVLVAFTNWKQTPQTFDAVMTTRRFPWLSGARSVYRVDLLTGATTPDDGLDGGGWTKEIGLAARETVAFKITGAKPCSWLSVT